VRLLEKAALSLQKGTIRDSQSQDSRGTSDRIPAPVVQESGKTYTERFLSSLIALISIFLRPILISCVSELEGNGSRFHAGRSNVGGGGTRRDGRQ
jgi:hypothetical protein